MLKFSVYIDGGYVGFVHANDLLHAREQAIKYYNIQEDQKVNIVSAGN